MFEENSEQMSPILEIQKSLKFGKRKLGDEKMRHLDRKWADSLFALYLSKITNIKIQII